MTLTLPSDMKLVNELVETGYTEVVTQATNAFFNGSNGGVIVENAAFQGDFLQRNFFKEISGLVGRRVNDGTGADGASTKKKFEEGDQRAARLAFGGVTVQVTLGALRSRNFSMDTISLMFGRQLAAAELKAELNSAIASLVGSVGNKTGANTNLTGTGLSGNGGLTYNALIDIMALGGDTATDIIAWVMPSAAYFRLMKDAKDASQVGSNVAGVTLFEGNVASFNKPIIVTDSPSLLPTSACLVAALKPGAITIRNDAMPLVASDLKLGDQNLTMQFQAEFDAAITIGGYRYSGSTKNPSDTVLANGANWALDASTVLHAPGGFIGKVAR